MNFVEWVESGRRVHPPPWVFGRPSMLKRCRWWWFYTKCQLFHRTMLCQVSNEELTCLECGAWWLREPEPEPPALPSSDHPYR